MSPRDRTAEREVADYAESVRVDPVKVGTRWQRIKRLGNNVLTGFAVGALIERIRGD